MRDEVVQAKAKSGMATLASINVSFSQQGLSKLLNDADAKDEAFKDGQFRRAGSLGDDTGKWLPEFKDNPIHGLFKVTGYPLTHIQNVVREKIKNPLGDTAISVIYEHNGGVRPGEWKGHEHCESIPYVSQLVTLALSRHTGSRLQRWYISTVRQIPRRRRAGA
jgi:hypothetical protein